MYVFYMNSEKLNCMRDKIDSGLLEKFNCAKYVSQQLHRINRQWSKLKNCDKQLKLKNRIKIKISKNKTETKSS